MILEIRLSNFYSIKEEIVLDMRAAKLNSRNTRTLKDNIFGYKDINLLKTAVLYGANASGKSNVIKAIRFCCDMVRNSTNHNENDVFLYKKFKFDNYSEKPSSFLIRFISNDVEYEYGFSLMQDRIITEELYFYPNGRHKKIFVRDENGGVGKKEKYSFGTDIKRPLDVAENTSNKTLYLSRASQMDREIPKELFMYFNNTLLLGYARFDTINADILFKTYKDLLLKALQIADSDIVNVAAEKISVPHKYFHINMKDESTGVAKVEDSSNEKLKFSTFHRLDPNISFDLITEESAGTKKLFAILLTILDVVANNKILLIDEIEESLHSDIIEYIFNLFKASEKSQLICTTHNTRFLDLTKFRKDQVYFVNKRDDASSDLYSLYDYSDFRDTMDLEKAYLGGRFDAIPIINSSLENLKQVIDG